MNDIEHLLWLRDRLIAVYGESPNVDFVLRFNKIINTLIDTAYANGKMSVIGARTYRKHVDTPPERKVLADQFALNVENKRPLMEQLGQLSLMVNDLDRRLRKVEGV